MAYSWFIVCLALSMCIGPSKSADVFVSIDCGSSESEPYTDENGISWLGDIKFVRTGEPRSVKPANSISRVADTMRVFTTGKKNCYRIGSVKQGRVLVRAGFYYGNYDGKSSPPTFDLLFDGNNWTRVVLTSNTEYNYYEVTYVMKSASISVCVAQTEPDQVPFITTLEVRSLETFMYRQVDDSTPLFTWRRVAFGTNTTIRFKDDPYDRRWAAGVLSKAIGVPSKALFSNRSLLEDRPPPAVLKHAMTEAGQFPFISALEVRSLESYMYDDLDHSFPLFLLGRSAFGTNTSIMYPEDPYGRIWSPGAFGKGSIKVSGDAVFSKQPSPNDNPPAAVLKNAITATTPNGSIELLMGFPSYDISVHINWHFSEVTRLGPRQNRSFTIFQDNESFPEQILPPYGDSEEWFINNITVSNKTTFSLVPTNVSTLPPIINAMEVFIIGDKLTDGTDRKDVQGLASLQKSFSVLQSWSGDPCLPSPYSWEWIQCDNDPIPRVTALLLGDYNLSGLLPDFSSMDGLQTIDFHNNRLQGPIPDFLGTLPYLKTLNLANNRFSGTVPASLSTNTGLVLMVAGNPDLCTSCRVPATAQPPSNSSIKKKKKLPEFVFAAMILYMIIL